MQGNGWQRGFGVMAMLIASLASLTPVAAQSLNAASGNENETASEVAEPLDEEQQAAVLRDALNYRGDDKPSAWRPAAQPGRPTLDWNRTVNSNGTAAYTVKRALPTVWDAKIGADLGLNDMPGPQAEPVWSVTPGARNNTGAAWANVQVPNVASLDARVGAGTEPSKFGVSRTVPLGGVTSLTLQNSYAVTEAQPGAPVTAASSSPTSVWSNDRQIKFNIISTGTSFGAGATSSTTDTVTHHKFSAEQKLFGNFNVTTTLNDAGTPTSSKSITAGYKTRW